MLFCHNAQSDTNFEDGTYDEGEYIDEYFNDEEAFPEGELNNLLQDNP